MPYEEEDSKTQENMGTLFILPSDIIANICQYFTVDEILLLCTVSKGMLVAVSQDRIWKFVYEKKLFGVSVNILQFCLEREHTCCWKASVLVELRTDNRARQGADHIRRTFTPLFIDPEDEEEVGYKSRLLATGVFSNHYQNLLREIGMDFYDN